MPDETPNTDFWTPPGLPAETVKPEVVAPAPAPVQGQAPPAAPDFWAPPPGPAETPLAAPVTSDGDQAARIERLATKMQLEAEPAPERTFAGEVGAGLVRGGLGMAKLVPQIGKIVGSDILGPVVKGITGTDLAKKAFTPMIEGLEDIAASKEWKPSAEAGGAPIDLDRIISNPGEVIGQITSQITNPRFWAAQLPEGAMSMIPAIVGAWAPRAVALGGQLGTALEAAKAAGDTVKVAEIGKRINRLGTIGMYGMSMAMEAGQGEEKVRAYDEAHPDKPVSWGARVVSILGTGVVAGGLEAFSLGKVLGGGMLGRVPVESIEAATIKNILNGKGGREIVKKVLEGVATEGLTEGAQSIVENAFPRGFFDKNQRLLEGVVESMLIGAALGGLGGGAGGITQHLDVVQTEAARIQELKGKAQEEAAGPAAPVETTAAPEVPVGGSFNRTGMDALMGLRPGTEPGAEAASTALVEPEPGPLPSAPPNPVISKQPWEMTRDEFKNWMGTQWKEKAGTTEDDLGMSGEESRKDLIQRALAEGKPVPPGVLADYPDLAAKYTPRTSDAPMGAGVVGVDVASTTKAEPSKVIPGIKEVPAEEKTVPEAKPKIKLPTEMSLEEIAGMTDAEADAYIAALDAAGVDPTTYSMKETQGPAAGPMGVSGYETEKAAAKPMTNRERFMALRQEALAKVSGAVVAPAGALSAEPTEAATEFIQAGVPGARVVAPPLKTTPASTITPPENVQQAGLDEAGREVHAGRDPLRFDNQTGRYNGEKLERGDILTDKEGNRYQLDRQLGYILQVDQLNAKGQPRGSRSFSVEPTDKTRYQDLFQTGENAYSEEPWYKEDHAQASDAATMVQEPSPALTPEEARAAFMQKQGLDNFNFGTSRNVGAPDVGITPKAQVVPGERDIPAPIIKRKGKGTDYQRALERNDLAALLHSLGGVDPKSYKDYISTPEERQKLGRLIGKNYDPATGQGGLPVDVMIGEAKAHFPDQFGHFEDAGDMVNHFLDGRHEKFLNKGSLEKQAEEHYADIEDQRKREGIPPERLSEIEADVAREIAAERAAIAGEQSPGEPLALGEDTPFSLKEARGRAATFFSQMQTHLADKLPGRGTGADLAKLIEGWGAKGQFKADELKVSGIIPWLQEQKGPVTKQQILDKLKEGEVQVKVALMGDKETPQFQKDRHEFEQLLARAYDDTGSYEPLTPEESARMDVLGSRLGDTKFFDEDPKGATKFQSYLTDLPESFTNRREMLLTVPTSYEKGGHILSEIKPLTKKLQEMEANWHKSMKPEYDALKAERSKLLDQVQKFTDESYKVPGAHAYGDTAADVNRFAHVFTADYVDPATGKKSLVVTETQSDWAREGRSKGWKEEHQREKDQLISERNNLGESQVDAARHNEISNRIGEVNRLLLSAPPDLPFAKNWHEVALKQAIRYAAENGYDGVMVVNGDMVKQRYDLSKKLDTLFYRKWPDSNNYGLEGKKDGETVFQQLELPETEIEKYVGKDIAQKIIDGAGEPGEAKLRTLSNLDLQIGGEWANNLYDKTIPSYLKKYVKQWGAEVSGKDVDVAKPNEINTWQVFDNNGDFIQETTNPTMAKQMAQQVGGTYKGIGKPESLTSFAIPESMRDSVLYRGQPLYSLKDIPQGERLAAFQESPFWKDLSVVEKAKLMFGVKEVVPNIALAEFYRDMQAPGMGSSFTKTGKEAKALYPAGYLDKIQFAMKEDGTLGLFGGDRPLSKFEKRLNGITSAYPDADPERVAQALRAAPKSSDRELAGLAAMKPGEASGVVQGTLTGLQRAEIAKRSGMPGAVLFPEMGVGGGGGLFDQAPEPARVPAGARPAETEGGPFVPARRESRGSYYWKDRSLAEEWAKKNGWPTEHIEKYDKGWAVQSKPGLSAELAGPDSVFKEAANAQEAGRGAAADRAAGTPEVGGRVLSENGEGLTRLLADIESRKVAGNLGDAEGRFWSGLTLEPASPEFMTSERHLAAQETGRVRQDVKDVVAVADAPFDAALFPHGDGTHTLIVSENLSRGTHEQQAGHEFFHLDEKAGDAKALQVVNSVDPASEAFKAYQDKLNNIRAGVGLPPLTEAAMISEVAADLSSGMTRVGLDGKEIDLSQSVREAKAEAQAATETPALLEKVMGGKETVRPPTEFDHLRTAPDETTGRVGGRTLKQEALFSGKEGEDNILDLLKVRLDVSRGKLSEDQYNAKYAEKYGKWGGQEFRDNVEFLKYSLKEKNQGQLIPGEPVPSFKEFEADLAKDDYARERELRDPANKLIPLYEGETFLGTRGGDFIKDAKGKTVKLTNADIYERLYDPKTATLPLGTETQKPEKLLGTPEAPGPTGTVEQPPGFFGSVLRALRNEAAAHTNSEKARLTRQAITAQQGWARREMAKAMEILDTHYDRFAKMTQEDLQNFTDTVEKNDIPALRVMAENGQFEPALLKAAEEWRRLSDGVHLLRAHLEEQAAEDAKKPGKPAAEVQTAYWEQYFPRQFEQPPDGAGIHISNYMQGKSLTGPEGFKNARSQLLFSDSIKPKLDTIRNEDGTFSVEKTDLYKGTKEIVETFPDKAAADAMVEEKGGIGLKPLDPNYVNMMKANLFEQFRFVAGKYIQNDLIEGGLISRKPEPGHTKFEGDKTLEGYYAHPDVVQVMDNFLSKGIANNILYKIYNTPTTFMNGVFVGFSFFHVTFSSVTSMAMGIGQNVGRAIGAAATGNFGVAGHYLAETAKALNLPAQFMLGGKGSEVYKNPDSPFRKVLVGEFELGELIDHFSNLGGMENQVVPFKKMLRRLIEPKQAELTQMSRSFSEAIQDNLGWPRKIAEAVAWPTMGQVVGRLKLAGMLRTLSMEMSDAKRAGTLADFDITRAAQEIGKKYDNTMGQMVQDNLSMKQIHKNILRLWIGFPGWNIGSFTDILQLGKGMYHTAKNVVGGATDIAMGRKPTWDKMSRSERMSMEFYGGTVLVMAVFGALAQKLFTGEWPNTDNGMVAFAKDVMMPQTGELMSNGQPERLRLPTYMRDILSLNHPVEMAKHKMNWPIRMFTAMVDNQDFFGTQIRDPYAGVGTQIGQEAKYVGKSLLPFGVQGYLATDAPKARALNLIGITKVPRLYSNTSAMNVIDDYNKQNRATLTSIEAEAEKNLKGDLRKLAKAQDEDGFKEAAQTAMEAGTLTRQQIKTIVDESQAPPGLGRFVALPVEWQVRAWAQANDKEKALWQSYFLKKIQSAKPEILIRNRDILDPTLREMGLDDAADAIQNLKISDKAGTFKLAGLGVRQPTGEMGDIDTVDLAMAKQIAAQEAKLGTEKKAKAKKNKYAFLGIQ